MTTLELLSRLDGVRPRGTGKWSARCIAHQDNNPSLSISEGERGLLVKCWAGCTLNEITAALGIEIKDLFFDAPTTHGHRSPPKPMKTDYAALAFRYELAALDRRLRAERVREAICILPVGELSDHDRTRITTAIARAEADLARADLFEAVADDLRLKEFVPCEGVVRHAV
jgi:hypothetical protein